MTVAEGQNRLVQFVEKKIRDSGLWGFFQRKIDISLTRILEPWEKSANLPLPGEIRLSYLLIDQNGITCNGEDFIPWKEICATAIQTEQLSKNYSGENYRKHLLIVLHSGKIISFELGDIAHLKGLLGHFIELYKSENKTTNNIRQN